MEKGLGRKHLAQALRQKKYTQNNPDMAKLSQTRKRVALTKKRRSDPEFELSLRSEFKELFRSVMSGHFENRQKEKCMVNL